MPTEIIIRDGVVSGLTLDPAYVFDASRNRDVADNFTWADVNLTTIYTMDSRYKSVDTNTIIFKRGNNWIYGQFTNLRYAGTADEYLPATQGNWQAPNLIIAQLNTPLLANTQYSLIQGCNTDRGINAVTNNQSIKRYAVNDISWGAYSMTLRLGTGSNVVIDCRSGRKYISVTVANFNFLIAHVFATDGSNFYLDGVLIAYVVPITIDVDGFTDLNAPNSNDALANNTPYISSTLFGGAKGYKFANSVAPAIYLFVYAIADTSLGNLLEMQELAHYRYGATLTTPIFTATAQQTLNVTQVVVFDNATFSGTIQII